MSKMSKRVLLGAVAAVIACGLAAADAPGDVTVTATRMTNAKLVVSHDAGWFQKDIALSTTVSTAGLHLGTPEGAAEFEARITDAAMAVCTEITRLYPAATPDEETCAKSATTRAMSKAHQLKAKAKSAVK